MLYIPPWAVMCTLPDGAGSRWWRSFSIVVMTRTVGELLEELSQQLPFSRAAAWDPVGLQLGDFVAPAHRVAVAHEITEQVMARLEEDPVDLVVAYHPLLFRATNRLVADRSAGGRAYRLVRAGTALGIVHTAFDVAQGGAAEALASELGLTQLRGMGPLWPADTVKVVVFAPESDADDLVAAMSTAGAGDIGAYSSCSFRVAGTGTFLAPPTAHPTTGRPGEMNRTAEVRIEMVAPKGRADDVIDAIGSVHRYEQPAFDVTDVVANAGFVGRVGELEAPMTLGEFADRVSTRLGTTVRVAGDAGRTVVRVAAVPGSGSTYLGSASGRADVLVTGDVSHHRARDALDSGLAVVDAGHVPTERPGVRVLYSLVAELVEDVVDLTSIDPDPWKE